MDFIQLSETAIRAALAAGKIIRSHLDKDIQVEKKDGGAGLASQVVTEVDHACEAVILDHLRPTCEMYDLALLSEEREDDGGRFEKDYFWCVDPMDGTLAFIRKQPGFSVSIALIDKGGTPCLGVVYDPSTEALYHAVKGKGAFRDHQAWELNPSHDYLTYVTDRKLKDTPRATEIEDLLAKEVKRLGLKGWVEKSGGGSVLNAIHVLEQGPACLLKFPKMEEGGGSIWDFAATACIYQELGMPATNFAGGRLDLNRRDSSFMNHEGVLYANFPNL